MDEPEHDWSFSVVIPVLNEADSIEEALDSLLAADLPDMDLELLVMDGLSEDGTREIVSGYVDRFDEVQLLDNERRTTPTGFNVGFEAATNDIVVVMSGHARVTEDFFTEIIDIFENRVPDADVVGTSVTLDSSGYVQTSIAGALMTRFGAGSDRFRRHEGYVETVSYGAYKREVIEAVGGMDPELPRGQDYEYNKRARESGYTIYQSRESTVVYEPRATFRSLLTQKFGNGRGKARIFLRDRSPLYRVLPVLGLVGAVSAAFVASTLSVLVFGLMTLLYLAVMGTTSIGIVHARDGISPRYLPGMLLALACIHVGFALGFCLKLVVGSTEDDPQVSPAGENPG